MAEPIVVARCVAGQLAYFPSAVRLAGGRVLAVFREGAGHVRSVGRILAVASDDEGRTWSEPEVLDLWAQSADTVTLADGSVLLAYGDASRTTYRSRPTLATVIEDPEGRWDAGGQHLVYDAGRDTFDQANPAVVELSRGLVLILTYDIFRREIVAVRKRRRTLV